MYHNYERVSGLYYCARFCKNSISYIISLARTMTYHDHDANVKNDANEIVDDYVLL